MSEPEPQDGLVAELLRWGLKADTLNAEANRDASELEERLRQARQSVVRAIALVQQSRQPLDPCGQQTQRITELAKAAAESATLADLLALNFQVEAARLDDDRGLDGVAHQIRSLADRGTRGAAEIDELASSLEQMIQQARQAWSSGQGALERAEEEIERALRSAEFVGRSLAQARSAMAQLSSGARTAHGAVAEEDQEAAARLAAAAEVRAGTIERLTRAVASGLRKTAEALEGEATRASENAERIESFRDRFASVVELVRASDEIARRAKQLAINADLAATRSDDPAFGLFAEEARRLGEQADETTALAQSHLSATQDAHAPTADACHEQAGSLRALARDLAGLLARFDEGAVGEQPTRRRASSSGRLGEVFRVDRAAAQELAQARASWRRLRGDEQGEAPD